jgi:hypothetical protein
MADVDESEADRLKRRSEWFRHVPSSARGDPAERLKNDALHLDWLITDLTAVLWHTTECTLDHILTVVIPGLLKVLARECETVVPRRGFREPAARFKRHVNHLKSTDDLPLRAELLSPKRLKRGDVLYSRALVLFASDHRFPPALFRSPRHRKAAGNRKPAMGTNPSN